MDDFDALRHRLHFGHTHASLSATLNLDDFIVRCCISAIKTSKLAFAALDLQAVHFTKAVFRGALDFIAEPKLFLQNAKFKRMYANLALDNDILREVIGKNSRSRELRWPNLFVSTSPSRLTMQE